MISTEEFLKKWESEHGPMTCSCGHTRQEHGNIDYMKDEFRECEICDCKEWYE